MSRSVNLGEVLEIGPVGSEVFRCVLEKHECHFCHEYDYGLLIVGKEQVLWICAGCNEVMPRPAQLTLVKK